MAPQKENCPIAFQNSNFWAIFSLFSVRAKIHFRPSFPILGGGPKSIFSQVGTLVNQKRQKVTAYSTDRLFEKNGVLPTELPRGSEMVKGSALSEVGMEKSPAPRNCEFWRAQEQLCKPLGIGPYLCCSGSTTATEIRMIQCRDQQDSCTICSSDCCAWSRELQLCHSLCCKQCF